MAVIERNKRILIEFYDPFTEDVLGVMRCGKYDPKMMINKHYRLLATAWIKTFSGVLKRSGRLVSRLRFRFKAI